MYEDAPARRAAAPFLWCLLAALLFGASTPASKSLLGPVGPFSLAGILYLGAALGVLPFAFRGGSLTAARRPRNLLRVGGVVLFGGVLGPALLTHGLAQAPAASVSLWLNLETVATALIAWAFFREHLSLHTVLAVVIVTAASALLAGAMGLALVPAALLVAAACTCWALDNNLSAVVDGLTPAQSTLVKGVAAGAMNLTIGLFHEGAALSSITLGGGLLVGALGYGASISLYVRGAHHLGAVRSQMIFSMAPFFGVVLSWVVLREPMLGAQLVAGALMVIGLVVANRETHGHEHTHDAVTHTHWHRHDDQHHQHAHEGHSAQGWHVHVHSHSPTTHAHRHRPDLHHRHAHGPGE